MPITNAHKTLFSSIRKIIQTIDSDQCESVKWKKISSIGMANASVYFRVGRRQTATRADE